MREETLSKCSLWVLAIRPKTLPAAVGPVAVGSAVAFSDGKFDVVLAFCCLVGAFLLQIGVNLANDYFDFKNNIDSEERLGPVRVTQSGLISPAEVKWGMIFCLFLAALIFLYLAQVGGVVVVIIGMVSVLAALAYSGGPYPLASNGLGELFVFIFFGLVAVGGTYYIQAARLSLLAVVAAVPPGLLITAIMVVNNLRDIDTDGKAGKRTLAVILGRSRTITEFKLLLLLSYLVCPVMVVTGVANIFILLPVVTGYQAWKLVKKVTEEQGTQLNEVLADTAKLSLIYSLLFAVGLIVGIS